jgi:sulfoxide reductase heme-binding subunit YedZ
MIEMPDRPGAPVPPRPRPVRHGPVYRGLPRPVRVAAWLAISAILGIIIGATFPDALRALGATAALAPSKLAWYGVRATGFLAFFAIAGSVIYGLLLSTKLLDAIAHRPVSFALHKDLALAGLALSGLHGLLLLGDHTYAFTPIAIATPFASPYAPAAVATGQLAFYLVAIVTGSFYVRRQIGQRAWRLIHYLTFLGFAGVTAHGIASGSDSAAPWASWAYLVPVAAVVFLFVYRVVTRVAQRRAGTHPRLIPSARPDTAGRPSPPRAIAMATPRTDLTRPVAEPPGERTYQQTTTSRTRMTAAARPGPDAR